MTLVYEPVCHGAEHAPFNAALLSTILNAYPGAPLSFCSEPAQGAAVRAMLDSTSARLIDWTPIDVAPRACRTTRERFGAEWRTIAQAAREARRVGAARVIASAITPAGLAALKCQAPVALRGTRLAVVHHSGLASVMGSRTTRALLAAANGTRLRHIVLGHTIRRAVVAQLPSIARSLAAMRHPYLFPGQPPAASIDDDRDLRFAFLGVATRDKGFDRFCRLAVRVAASRNGAPAAPRFELIGRVGSEFSGDEAGRLGAGVVEMPPGAEPMPRRVYEERVRRTSYAVLPYAAGHYALVSSGAILDAFVFARPCIALRNPLFEEYFDAMGDIGYLCDTEEEMADLIVAIAKERPAARYAAQCRNILAGRKMFSPEVVAGELRTIMARERAVRAPGPSDLCCGIER